MVWGIVISDSRNGPDPPIDTSAVLEVLQGYESRLADQDRRLRALEQEAAASALVPTTLTVSPPASPPASAGPSWVWEGLEADRLREVWEDLVDWITEQCAAHEVSDGLPREWYRSRGLVVQLAALKDWYDTVNRPAAHPRDAAEWHEAFYRMVDLMWLRYAVQRSHGSEGELPPRSERQMSGVAAHIDTQVALRRKDAVARLEAQR